jgi:DNA-binding response OmpR family regulator
MYSHALADQNFRTIHASNGVEAFTMAVLEMPDLILLDVMMPGFDGYETLAKIKGDPNTHTIKVMMLTAVDRPLERRLARQMGASGYLVKPVRLDELDREIRAVMAKGD